MRVLLRESLSALCAMRAKLSVNRALNGTTSFATREATDRASGVVYRIRRYTPYGVCEGAYLSGHTLIGEAWGGQERGF